MTQATATWRPSTRVAFRFCVVYFGLFCVLLTQIPFALLGWWAGWSAAGSR